MKSFLHYIGEMAQTRERQSELLKQLYKPNISREELLALQRKAKKELHSPILYGKGGRKMKKPPSVTRGEFG
jgi:hypothetical protein